MGIYYSYDFGCRLRPPYVRVMRTLQATMSWWIVPRLFRQFPMLADHAESKPPLPQMYEDVSFEGEYLRVKEGNKSIGDALSSLDVFLEHISERVFFQESDNDGPDDFGSEAPDVMDKRIADGLAEMERDKAQRRGIGYSQETQSRCPFEDGETRVYDGSIEGGAEDLWLTGKVIEDRLSMATSVAHGPQVLWSLYRACCERLDERLDERSEMFDPWFESGTFRERDDALRARSSILGAKPSMVAHMAHVIADDRPLVREMGLLLAAITGLGAELDPDLLRSAMRDESWLVQWAAVRAISDLGSGATLFVEDLEQVLTSRLGSRKETVQQAALRALGEIAPERLTRSYIALLLDSDNTESSWLARWALFVQ